ncbi:2'-5' RNA ligase family protein [Tersicoccus sp. MR15.9]|uniref:2'-5' RNA ligase family protein n=1 Tax=Tersicoccus mangrovi TaxID=3121635 RepID=UPI002FE61126
MHSIEFTLDDVSDDAVRADWDALLAAGLPSAGAHRSASNRPHVTVLAATSVPDVLQAAATASLGPLLPLPVRWGGLVLFGNRRLVLARLVEVDRALTDVVHGLHEDAVDVAADPHRAWVPHVTLCRRLDPGQVGTALAVLRTVPDVAPTLAGLRRWNPEHRTVTPLAG